MSGSSGILRAVGRQDEREPTVVVRAPGFYWIYGAGEWRLRPYKGKQPKLHVEYEILAPAPDDSMVDAESVEDLLRKNAVSMGGPQFVTRYYNYTRRNGGLVVAGPRTDLMAEYVIAGGDPTTAAEGINPDVFTGKVFRAKLVRVETRDGGAPRPHELQYLKVGSIWSLKTP